MIEDRNLTIIKLINLKVDDKKIDKSLADKFLGFFKGRESEKKIK